MPLSTRLTGVSLWTLGLGPAFYELPAGASDAAFGHGGAPSQISFCDPEVGLSFAFVTNGYPVAGYDRTRSGRNRTLVISNMAADCVP